MRRELLVPKLGLTMSEGVLVEWMVRPGETFRVEQGLFVIESEKAANEIGAEADGVLLETTAEAGATLPCGAVIGYWDDGREGGPPASDPAEAVAAAARPTPTPLARVPVTPLARRLAAQRGIDLSQLAGSGPRGRIRARDLPEAQAPAMAAAASPQPESQAGDLRLPTALEQTVARRLTEAKQQVPHFYLAVEAEVSQLLELRARLNAAQEGQAFTLNHFLLAAVGRALAEMPQLNRVWTDAGIRSFAHSDVGMAVDTERGLLVPVLRNVGAQPLAATARAARDAAERAKTGRLTAAEMAGGAITVSNAGMHGVTYMSSIINPGQAMILGVGAVREVFRPGKKGKPRLRREMGLVLSADHRVLDGVSALGLLKRITGLLENPLALLVA
ncbi:MAG: dihydrolipoamide acetyltransferase family protein [Comamonas sp.]